MLTSDPTQKNDAVFFPSFFAVTHSYHEENKSIYLKHQDGVFVKTRKKGIGKNWAYFSFLKQKKSS